MNIKNNILILLILSFFSVNLLVADEKKDVLDEELPAVNPFLSGAGASGSNSIGASDGSGNAITLNNLKLSGIIFGESTRFAIFSFPDGTTVKYEEDSIIQTNLMLLDIFIDHVYIKLDEQEYSIDMKNNIVKAEG
tara:strand:+ start:4917 stop:5324 length:408 start_codon:yes stop_codon:yes gene_type:complete